MLRLFFDRSQRVLLPALVAGLLLLALTLVAGAQPGPSITVTPSVAEAQLGENVTFNLAYGLPDGANASPPGVITATWSANGSLVNASEGYVTIEDSSEIRWGYREGLPLSNELPSFELKVGELPDPIVVTATLIVSATDQTIESVSNGNATITIIQPVNEVEDRQANIADLSQSTLVISPTGTITAGTPITITVVVSNTGQAPAENVTVHLFPNPRLQDVTTIAPFPDSAELVATTVGITFSLSSPIAVQEERQVSLSAMVPLDAVGELAMSGKITATGGISQPLSSTMSIAPRARPQVILEIDGPSETQAGDVLTLSLRLRRIGAGILEDVKVAVETDPAVKLSIVGSEEIASSEEEGKLILTLASLKSDVTEVKLTGTLLAGLEDFSVNAEVLNLSEFVATDSQLKSSHQLAVQPLPPPVPTSTEAPGETQAVVTPTVSPTATPPEGEDKKAIDSQRLLLVGAVALVAALGAGFLLLFLLRGRGKPKSAQPSVPSASETEPPSSPAVVPTTPLPVSRASLESVSLPGMRLRLEPDVTTIGRAPDSIIRIDERYMNWETVSRQHAEIRREGDYYVIYDVSNSNGVYVEGQRTARNLLRSGWRIGIGGVEFIFHDAAPAGQ
jgi:hypothetical protein